MLGRGCSVPLLLCGGGSIFYVEPGLHRIMQMMLGENAASQESAALIGVILILAK